MQSSDLFSYLILSQEGFFCLPLNTLALTLSSFFTLSLDYSLVSRPCFSFSPMLPYLHSSVPRFSFTLTLLCATFHTILSTRNIIHKVCW